MAQQDAQLVQPPSLPSGAGPSCPYFSNAFRFWEPRRIIYNLVLLAIVVAWFAISWPHFRPAMNFLDIGRLFILGALANVLYSAAYLADVLLQLFNGQLQINRFRWMIWGSGDGAGHPATNYWIADELYPFVQR